MSRVLPILFNTDMVRAILDGRKTVTRRAIHTDTSNQFDVEVDGSIICYIDQATGDRWMPEKLCRYQPGDIMYVRETWCRVGEDVDKIHFEHSDTMWNGMYLYKADGYDLTDIGRWRPSIHMPKEASRIWLKVTDVRVERLQDISEEQIVREGIKPPHYHGYRTALYGIWVEKLRMYIENEDPHYVFSLLWNSTIKRLNLASCGWKANPYVWVIEFEQCENPERHQNCCK